VTSAAVFNSAISLELNRTSPAPLFSSMCAICVVPGIGTIHGFWAISQARAMLAGVVCF